MGESFKAVCSLILIVAAIASGFSWFFADRPDALTWGFRIVSPAVAILALAVLLKVHHRQDLAPDLLQLTTGGYFNREGFCFAFGEGAFDGMFELTVFFQNQYGLPCEGQIALRPARGFWGGRAKMDTINIEIGCAGGAFGFASLPVAVPHKLQGKELQFEVGASVEYPHGKGKRLRFHDGIHLRTDASFRSGFSTALVFAGALSGRVVLVKPATTTLSLPENVAEELPQRMEPTVVTTWKPGDPLPPVIHVENGARRH